MPDPGPGLRLDDQLCFALYVATNAITRVYRPLLAEIGMTYPQYLVMLVLWQDGPMSIGKIATRLRLGPSAVVPLVDQLQRSGFVRRCKDDIDRRIVNIELTEAGVAIQQQVREARDVVVCRLGMDDDEIERMRRELIDLTLQLAGRPEAENTPA